MQLGLDKGLVWIKFSSEEIILPVVNFSVVFVEHGGTTDVVLGGG